MIGESNRVEREYRRILWRQRVLSTPAGVEWLVEQVRRRVPERDLGPDRADAPVGGA